MRTDAIGIRPRLLMVFAGMTIAVVVLVAGELALRVARPVVDRYRGSLFADDLASLDLFVNDPELHWALRRPTTVRGRGGRDVPREAPSDPERSRPAERWQVVNAGVPGYSSFQARLHAERLIPASKSWS